MKIYDWKITNKLNLLEPPKFVTASRQPYVSSKALKNAAGISSRLHKDYVIKGGYNEREAEKSFRNPE